MSEPIKCGVAFFLPNWIDLSAAVYAAELGFDALWIGEHIAFHIPTFDALTAMAAVAARLQQVYQQPFARLVEKYCTAGTPETCRASLQAYVDAGVRTFILSPPVTSADEFRQQLAIYAREILPGLRA